jgi:hypothetical protein
MCGERRNDGKFLLPLRKIGRQRNTAYRSRPQMQTWTASEGETHLARGGPLVLRKMLLYQTMTLGSAGSLGISASQDGASQGSADLF